MNLDTWLESQEWRIEKDTTSLNDDKIKVWRRGLLTLEMIDFSDIVYGPDPEMPTRYLLSVNRSRRPLCVEWTDESLLRQTLAAAVILAGGTP